MTGTTTRSAGGTARSTGPVAPTRRARALARSRELALGQRWWWAGAVIAGLFAMHGLGMSAEACATMHQGSDMAASQTSATGHHGDGAVTVELAERQAASLAPMADGSPEQSGAAGLLGLCLTLLSLGLLWLLGPAGSRRPWSLPRSAGTARSALLPVTARDLSPPSRAALSIWRC